MTTIRTILAPIDFSDRSAVAAQHAVALALHYGSRVVFAHVIEAAPAEFRAQALGHDLPDEIGDAHSLALGQTLQGLVLPAFEEHLSSVIGRRHGRPSLSRWCSYTMM
jgi:nucleotide-binding universal stress UspA family protein